MCKDPEAFRDEATRLTYAYKQTERHYDEYPPNDDIVPIAAAINAWTLICGCYMGIEQTMKLLIMMRMGIKKLSREHRIHDLNKLYSLLDESERLVVAAYYRVYRSLHNFDAGDLTLETADDFIEYIGEGYNAWRYILVESTEVIPKLHLGLMIEIWRALTDVVRHRVNGMRYTTLADVLAGYFRMSVIRAAEMDDDWQAASQDEKSGICFGGIRDWVGRNGGYLRAGTMLFDRRKRESLFSSNDSPVLRKVLVRAADNSVRSPIALNARKADIATFHQRICNGGLAWNAERGVFE